MTGSGGFTQTIDWLAFTLPVERVFAAAESWRAAVVGVERPWLCWHVNDRWTRIQSRLVACSSRTSQWAHPAACCSSCSTRTSESSPRR